MVLIKLKKICNWIHTSRTNIKSLPLTLVKTFVGLKVPSHQIRLALKWYGWIEFHEYKNRGWETQFENLLLFLNLKFSSLSGILLKLSALHAIRGFCMPFALKGIWKPFAIALKAIRHSFARCKKVFDYRKMQYSFIFADFSDFACGI